MDISVHNLDEQFGITNENIIDLIKQTIKKIKLDIQSCHVIFVNDEKLRKMHKDYLNNSDYTDVITFNLGEDSIESEIYISIDRVKENAIIFKVSVKNEVYRNIIHGLLHLKGYTDKDVHDRSIMKHEEEKLLKQVQIL